MSGVNNRIRRFLYRLKHDLSIENIVLIIAVIMCLTWTCQSIAAMSRNWALTDRLATANRDLALLELEVETLELENAYYSSAEYQELLARKHASKQLPGEHLVYLPENSEAAKSKHASAPVVTTTTTDFSNFDKWLHFLFP